MRMFKTAQVDVWKNLLRTVELIVVQVFENAKYVQEQLNDVHVEIQSEKLNICINFMFKHVFQP